MDNEGYKIRQIPDNFSSGINIGGLHFKPIFLAEGIIFAVIFFLLAFIALKSFGMDDIGKMLGICLVFASIAFIAGIKGINDEPITTFIKNIAEFNKHKRTAYYNPRIKLEAKSIKAETAENKNALPKDKIMAIYSKYKEAFEKKQQEKTRAFEEENAFDESNMYFEDDIGIIKKPRQYFSDNEEQTYQKKKKHIAKFKENHFN